MILKRLTQEQATTLYRKAVLPDPGISRKERDSAREQIVSLVKDSGISLDSIDMSKFTWKIQSAFKSLTKI